MVPREIAPCLYDSSRGSRRGPASPSTCPGGNSMQTVVTSSSSARRGHRAGIGGQPGRRGVVYRELARQPSRLDVWLACRAARSAPPAEISSRQRAASRASIVLVHPNIDPIAFAIGPLAVRWYGLMYLVGFAAGWWLGLRRNLPEQIPDYTRAVRRSAFLAVLGVVPADGSATCSSTSPANTRHHPLEIFAVWQGAVVHGAAAGVMLAMWFAARALRVGFLREVC